jgi:hypothetical protein
MRTVDQYAKTTLFVVLLFLLILTVRSKGGSKSGTYRANIQSGHVGSTCT